VPLPAAADGAAATATNVDGVLTVRVPPWVPPAGGRRIPMAG